MQIKFCFMLSIFYVRNVHNKNTYKFRGIENEMIKV